MWLNAAITVHIQNEKYRKLIILYYTTMFGFLLVENQNGLIGVLLHSSTPRQKLLRFLLLPLIHYFFNTFVHIEKELFPVAVRTMSTKYYI
jgi:hypothetical protein